MVVKSSKSRVDTIKSIPIITFGIIIANVIVYIITTRDNAGSAFQELSAPFIYGLIPSHLHIGKMLSANFIHASPVHLIVNMGLLYLFGRDVEKVMGKLEYAIFYLGACFASSILHVAIVFATLPPYYADIPVVGASGAVAGVMAIYMVRYHRRVFNFFGLQLPAIVIILGWLLAQLVFGVLGLYRDSIAFIGLKQVSYWAHLGGFTFGIITALVTNMALQGEREHLIDEARKRYDEGNLLEATQRYEQLLRYDPDNAYAHAELGRLWAILEEEDQSLPYYQMAIELYINQGKEGEALLRAEEMKRFWPEAVVAAPNRFRFASYLEDSGHTEHAIQALRKIVEEEPESVEAQMSLLKIGQLELSVRHDPVSAITALHEFLERYPTSEWRKFAEKVLNRAQSVSYPKPLKQS